MGLSTLFGLGPRGFFIPFGGARRVPPAGGRPPYEALENEFGRREDAFRQVLRQIDGLAVGLERIGGQPPPAPRWDQDWFPRLDAAVAYAMARTRKPGRIVEVGSGHSTRFFARAAADGGSDTRITAIDPAPRADLQGMTIEHLATPVEDAGPEVFSALAAGDFLVVDSSHVLMPGTDVDFLLNRVLPALPQGVLVHFHDIFLPDDYPPQWDWRGYNEQLGVSALMEGGGYRILWSSRYVATRMAGALEGTVVQRLPLVEGAMETSLWLLKTEAPK